MKTTRKFLILVMALLLVPAASASAASYKGKTNQNRPVTFKLSGGKVKSFTGGVNLFCVGSGIEFNAVIPPKPLKVKNGKFSYKGRDKIDSADIVIKGKISGSKASGSLSMQHTKYDSSTRLFQPCSGKAKWSAKKK
jgi:hypothetical protein